jgi:hypothetical protein
MDFIRALETAGEQGVTGDEYDNFEVQRRLTVTDEMRHEARNRATVGRFGNALVEPREFSINFLWGCRKIVGPKTQARIREHNVYLAVKVDETMKKTGSMPGKTAGDLVGRHVDAARENDLIGTQKFWLKNYSLG